MQQFYYNILDDKGEPTENIGSFNVEEVTRTMADKDGRTMVLMSDWHTDLIEIEHRKTKEAKPVMTIQSTEVNSKILLSKEDAERYRSLTELK